jgi:4-hydroxybenzoate polyprenyltransferase
MSRDLPLILDMDGTLLLTDTLVEAMTERLFSAPLQMLALTASLSKGRAHLKARLAEASQADYDAIPARQDLVDYAKAEQAAGREIWLVTAADQAIAEKVAARFDFFTGAVGSNGSNNLKGSAKQAFLRERFAGGYVYAGDSSADLEVWRDSDAIVLAGASASVARRARTLDRPVEAVFDNSPGGAKAWRKALRLHQWAKNLLVFAPLLLSGLYVQPDALIAAVSVFFGLGLAASGTYILNDLADLSADRRHRSKHTRPFAAGVLAPHHGLLAAPLLILAGLAVTLAGGGVNAVVALLTYLVVTLAYSFGLKRKALVDVFLLAALFTLRLLIGAAALGAVTSPWLFSFSMFFFFSLSLAKRHVEIIAGVPGEMIRGRGYAHEDAPLSLALGVSSAMASIVILCLYIIEDAFPAGLYQAQDWLLVAPALIGGWTMRIWLLAHRGRLDDDPVSFAVKDKVSLAMGAGLFAAFVLASLS